MRRLQFLTLVVFIVLLFSGMAQAGCGNAQSSIRIGWVRINLGEDRQAARYTTFTGRETVLVDVNSGQTLTLGYATEVGRGALSFEVLNPENEVIWEVSLEEGRSDTVGLVAEQNGTYKLVIEGQDTGGSFDVSWEVGE